MRIFTPTEERALARKPYSLDEVPAVRLTHERFAALEAAAPVIHFTGGLKGLDAALEHRPDDGLFQMVARGPEGAFLVNTEGYSYARYVARACICG